MMTGRIFLAALLVPGLGFVVVDRLRLGLLAVTLYFVPVLFFSLSRLITDPVGYYALVMCVLLAALWAIIHSTRIAFNLKDEKLPSVGWKTIIAFSVVVLTMAFATVGSRGKTLGYESYSVPSASMSPTIVSGDYILVDTWAYSDSDPQIGELVVFILPDLPGVKYIKRVVGGPGDTIELRNNILYRNGQLTQEPYVHLSDGLPNHLQTIESVTIAPNEYFVLGDNRNRSRDSRLFGPVSRTNIEGRVAHLWYSSINKYPENFK